MTVREHISPACYEGICDGCTGYSGGYDTWLCDCRCHARPGTVEPTAGHPSVPVT